MKNKTRKNAQLLGNFFKIELFFIKTKPKRVNLSLKII